MIWLNKTAMEGYTSILDFEALVLIKDLYHHGKAGSLPVNPQAYASRCALSNILTITFGTRTESVADPLVARVLYLSREFMNCIGPMSNLIDFVPILQKLPHYMKTRAQKLHADLVDTYGGMILDIDARIKRGESVPDCLAKTLLQVREEEKLDRLDIILLSAAFMIGGVETASFFFWSIGLET